MSQQNNENYGPRLAHLEGQVGGISTQMTGLAQGLVELGHKVDRIIDKAGEPKPTNWGWVVAAILAAGGAVTLYTGPIQRIADNNAENIHDQAQAIVAINAEQVRAHARTDAQIEFLTQRIDEMDEYGTRHWRTLRSHDNTD